MVALEMMKQWCTDNRCELEDVMCRTTLYVTLEPCIMCASALYHLHLKKILYGAANERFGGLLSVGTREKYGAKHFIEIMPNLNVNLNVMARFEEKPEKAGNVLVFEDATNGVYAAIAAGMHVVMVPDLTYMKIPDELQNKINLILRSLEDFKPESIGLPAYDRDNSE
ncbi:tRNA-specific adenosine deaminase 2 [Wuchereria bancrofti]|uniref:tRNA-specific adenosine deaminase 2 n=1 Tax=Wuchereria bancrofti TaxID=6293 RepID=J9EAZ1_WUCBA|nr:tRNA-specific adenosine deaminase 2 [Wuchereria bancrofti]